MKATEFPVVVEASRAAHGHLGFFNKMMAAKTASLKSVHKNVIKKKEKVGDPAPRRAKK